MTEIAVHTNILCSSEFSLAIALTVFVALTAILTVLLIFLAVSKNFRAVFFREKQHKKSRAGKVRDNIGSNKAAAVDTVPVPAPKKTSARKASASDEPEYLSAIPTVPLGGAPVAVPQKPKAKRSTADDEKSLPAQSSGNAYVTRTITITRARSTDKKSEKSPAKTDRSTAADKRKN